MIAIGIDPGTTKCGGIGIIQPDGSGVGHILPVDGVRASQRLDVPEFVKLVYEAMQPDTEPVLIAVEEQQPIRIGANFSVKATVRLMRIEGEIVGALRTLARFEIRKAPVALTIMPPKRWHKALPVKTSTRAEREELIKHLCSQRFLRGVEGVDNEHTRAALVFALAAMQESVDAVKNGKPI